MKRKIINRQNYEEYIPEYLDGTLGPVEAAELLLFLEQNPDLRDEVERIDEMVLSNESQTGYPFKEALKSAHDQDALLITEDNYTYYFIAFCEGDLTETGKQNVDAFLSKHPSYRESFNLMSISRLKPDANIHYPDIRKIRKVVPLVKTSFLRYAALAATILILVTVYLRIQPENEEALRETIGGIETPLPGETPLPNKNTQRQTSPLPVKTGPEIQTADHTKQETPQEKTTVPSAPATERQPAINRLPAHRGNLNTGQPFIGNTRDLYSGLYEDIRLSQEMLLAYEESTAANETEKGIFAGRHLPGLIRSGAQLAKQVPESLNAWMLADLGIQGFNMMTDNELKLERQLNASGETAHVRLLDGEIAYSLRRNQN